MHTVMMHPFDISEYTLDEIFRTDYSKSSWPAGAFFYQLRLSQMPIDKLKKICKWLSINCTENYIVSIETLEILSGGTTNNKSNYWRRNRNISEETSTIKIRLAAEDILLFRLTWVL